MGCEEFIDNRLQWASKLSMGEFFRKVQVTEGPKNYKNKNSEKKLYFSAIRTRIPNAFRNFWLAPLELKAKNFEKVPNGFLKLT